jgi:hypothetical protein
MRNERFLLPWDRYSENPQDSANAIVGALVHIAPWLRKPLGERDALCEETPSGEALPDGIG